MTLLRPEDRPFADAVSRLVACNPFLPERIEHERAALGPAFIAAAKPWNVHPAHARSDGNITRLVERAAALVEVLRERLVAGARPAADDRRRYEDLAIFVLYHRFLPRFGTSRRSAATEGPSQTQAQTQAHDGVETISRRHAASVYREFSAEARRLFDIRGVTKLPTAADLPHLFACFFQVRRAFDSIFGCIIGTSKPAVRLRSEVWQSIFTHDIRRYRRRLYERMEDLTTLITGPSGTGKELVARAVGGARYIAFDPTRLRFVLDEHGVYQALNLSALSPSLIESELFGHRRGAFTGAVADHVGWLERCPREGSIFLDEIGDLDPSIQVKLLRVLQTREVQRIGDTTPRAFRGKIIAATNRDLAQEMAAGRFREDLYYRLCSDLIRTPALHERLADAGDELHDLVSYIVEHVLGEADASFVTEILGWIDDHLGHDYAWPGNIRELEQCVRNILVRGTYRPACADAQPRDEPTRILDRIADGALTADELLCSYCTLVYARCGNYVETARRLGVDRRTVRARIDTGLLARLT